MAKPMTKTQLVAALAEEMGADKKAAGAALEAVCALITKEVSGGGAVTLPGVGKIYCRERPERMVRNPATGESFKKDADKVVKMTIAKALKDRGAKEVYVYITHGVLSGDAVKKIKNSGLLLLQLFLRFH